MGGSCKPGPLGYSGEAADLSDGTMIRMLSPRPGPIGGLIGVKQGLIEITRKWETARSTISEFIIPDAAQDEITRGYILERPGPDTTASGLRKRIPEGTYNLKWQTTTNLRGVRPHLPVPWLYNRTVADNRYIYIHNGNHPHNTDGCLLVGTRRAPDFVGFSVDALTRLKRYLERVGIENVALRIRSDYQ